ncbi:MAG: hypothetical protein F6K37_24400 [Moorea sp. SIO4E2]|uniref:hypothetical protein n=1 Tax=Moorena sp. SIO4E2 TaxID=2607826 RepID=UPI0013BA132E|nr:hypothetical protein [Moorena sp. SIO4E2]NEQ08967.1 hypothetical protein [Moorena sp. SIO4E2]
MSTSFKKTHPLDFNVYEGEDKEPVIFIENGTKGQELTLEIVNNSDQPITLPTKSGAVGADNHHFELRFRPDTLSPDSLQQLVLAEKEGWSMTKPPVTQANGMVSLYFLATNNQALGAKQTISLTLQHINGAAAGGARTTRVELRCPQFTQGETFNNYYRENRLSIVSHRGKKHIPLHVGFVGSNRILNDGSSPNQLILRITNVLHEASKASKFIISFDVDNDWALGTKSQVENITIEGKDLRPNEQPEEDWNIEKNIEGETPTWTITHQNEEEPGLAPGQVVQLTISNIISSLPSGQANLYLRYENIPGYWDGTFVCTIEKSAILYKDGNVGIGTTSPSQKLEVAGNALIAGDLFLNSSANVSLHYGNRGKLGETPNFNPDNDNNGLWLEASADGSESGGLFCNGNTIVLWSAGDNDLLRVYDEDAFTSPPQFVINNSGNVGIGTTSPSQKLEVAGNALIAGDLFLNSSANVSLHYGNRGKLGETTNFNPDNDNNGLWLEASNDNESGGLFCNGNTIVLWSAGDNDLLRVYDEDSFTSPPKFVIDSSGNVGIGGNTRLGGNLEVTGNLTIGTTVIGEHELRILKALASGYLEVDLYNTNQHEYLYASDYKPYDSDRRRVFTWRPGNKLGKGRWCLRFPS